MTGRSVKAFRRVHVPKGQTLEIVAGRGAVVHVQRDTSGAVEIRNAATGKVLRQWSPKEARHG